MAEVPAVSVRDLRKSFGALEVLKGVTFDAHDGDVISILGASGSGKSTLLRCINMLETPTAGDVVVAGETIKLRQRRDGRNPTFHVGDHPQIAPGVSKTIWK